MHVGDILIHKYKRGLYARVDDIARWGFFGSWVYTITVFDLRRGNKRGWESTKGRIQQLTNMDSSWMTITFRKVKQLRTKTLTTIKMLQV